MPIAMEDRLILEARANRGKAGDPWTYAKTLLFRLILPTCYKSLITDGDMTFIKTRID